VKDLQARLDQIRPRITSVDFLQGRGLGKDVPFYAFDYPAVAERQVSNHLSWLIADITRKTDLRIGHVNVFEVAVEQLKSRGLYDKALSMETAKGVPALLNAVKGPLEPGKLSALLMSRLTDQKPDMVILSSVGAAYPLVRTHSLLNNLQPLLDNIPLILFFPGRFSGQTLQLFGELQETPYYRAFRLVD
jgi:Domain of unknown function (DUF1788)